MGYYQCPLLRQSYAMVRNPLAISKEVYGDWYGP